MKYVYALCLILVSSGCATLGVEQPENVSQLQAGMSEAKILSLLGTPDSVVATGQDQSRWVYNYKHSDKQGHNLYVDFANGNLVKAGELSSRDLAAADEHRIPGTCTRKKHKEMMQESLCIQ